MLKSIDQLFLVDHYFITSYIQRYFFGRGGQIAQQPANSREIREISIVKATNYIGYSVASKVQGRVYLGKIISHAEKLDYNNNECIVWTAVFRGEEEYDEDKQQSSNPFPRYEDFTYHRMKQANALWRGQCRLMKTGDKIVLD